MSQIKYKTNKKIPIGRRLGVPRIAKNTNQFFWLYGYWLPRLNDTHFKLRQNQKKDANDVQLLSMLS